MGYHLHGDHLMAKLPAFDWSVVEVGRGRRRTPVSCLRISVVQNPCSVFVGGTSLCGMRREGIGVHLH